MTALTREQMGQAICDLCAGQETEPAFNAQADALAVGVGGLAYLSGLTETEAHEYLDRLVEGMHDHIRQNWGRIERNSH